jgi:hypothetical protein
VVLECANGLFCLVAAMHVRWDKLKLGILLEGDGFLISRAGLIVQIWRSTEQLWAAKRVMMALQVVMQPQ